MNGDEQWLRGVVRAATPDPPRGVDFDRVAAAVAAGEPRRRFYRVALVFAASVAVVLVALGVVALSRDDVGAPSPQPALSNSVGATTKQISYRGVRVVIPASWPVIDGAHAGYGCSSLFAGQSDRAFLGRSYRGMPSCPGGVRHPPPADGIWMQPGGPRPSRKLRTIRAGGHPAYLEQTYGSAVTLWFHRVQISIGIGPDRRVERAIMASIAYLPGADTPVLGRCPSTNAMAMPEPTRVTVPFAVGDGNQARMAPEPPDVKPMVSAAEVWRRFRHGSGPEPRRDQVEHHLRQLLGTDPGQEEPAGQVHSVLPRYAHVAHPRQGGADQFRPLRRNSDCYLQR